MEDFNMLCIYLYARARAYITPYTHAYLHVQNVLIVV